MSTAPRILIMDDDAEIIESLQAILESRGYRVVTARDGSTGLELAEADPPDLLILDMMMPKKSGFLVLEKLRTRPEGLIPTIMMTGNEGSRHRAYAEMLGVKDYLRKPFPLDKLLKAIREALTEAGHTLPEADVTTTSTPEEEDELI
ncbi:response regulator [bacterium]|nr:response regulator [bacterium]